MEPPDKALRERVQRMAARGVSPALAHTLLGQGYTFRQFQRFFAQDLKRGAAEADAAVSEALFDLALSGKSPPVMLAWAKQRLGWSTADDDKSLPAPSAAPTHAAVATLRTLLEQVASAKSGGAVGADEVADTSASESTAAVR